MDTVILVEEDLIGTGLPTLWMRGIPFFNKNDALKFIDYCINKNIFILGIEGFKIENRYRTPDMEFIGDFSAIYAAGSSYKEKIGESAEAAHKFVSMPATYDIMFEFILCQENDANALVCRC
ncbi:MAG: hypothetical protein LBC79_01275 [Deltaproteobacteria bacterium]|jgi:hypothetical protein|nr:hypothetical protein [Deltaproteobacteria bacterium]